MDSRASNPPSITIYLYIIALAQLAAGVPLMLLARSSGYSTLRLLLVGVDLLLAAAAAGVGVLLHSRPRLHAALRDDLASPAANSWLRIGLGVAFLAFWSLTWLPPQYTGDVYYYFVGLYPLVLSGLFASGIALIYILAAAGALSTVAAQGYFRKYQVTYRVMLIFLAACLIVALVTWLGHLLLNNEPFWRGAGVPVLALQVLISLVCGILIFQLEMHMPSRSVRNQVAVFLFIWVIAAILWSQQPIGESFWVTGPRLPNHEYYPFSDLETFDLGSQFALIGQGIFNHQFWDRALYMSLLVYLHAIAGQDYQAVMALQAALFAVLPALMYLLGTKLHSRTAGCILAILTILRGLNSLTAAQYIHSSTFKHMLTDFPTGAGLAGFLLLMLHWLESPERRRGWVWWASGILGLTSLLRPHAVALLPLVILLALVAKPGRPGGRLLLAGLSLFAFLVAIAPWTFMGSGANSFMALYGQRIRDVVAQRYPQFASTPVASTFPPVATLEPAPPESAGPDEVPPAPPAVAATPLPPGARELPAPGSSVMPFPILHYVNNLITSVLVFPDSPSFMSLQDTLTSGEDFWKLRWNGRMSSTAGGMLILNLALIGLGLGAAFQRERWRGLLPLAVFLIYHGANAVARTSGGRYLVPVDWILVCYFALGMAELVRVSSSLWDSRTEAIAAPASASAAAAPAWSTRQLLILPALFLIGGLIPLAGMLYPLRYPPK
ncbi:MAG TPA: hypothetical protein VFH29_02060, partial [Anaerolineales bacterium]|nr:hypothetical protein [Anaerolineales bacterium]